LFTRVFRFILLAPALVVAAGSGVFRIGCFDFPTGLNPVYATSETAQAVMNKVHQALFYFDATGAPGPELVDTLRLDGTLRIWIALKKGVRFSDGSSLQSRDVAATFDLLKDPRYEYPYLSDLEFIEKITIIDPLHFCITLKEEFAPWKSVLTFKVLSAEDIRGLDPVAFRKHLPMGCGPYQLDSVDEPRAIVLKENPFFQRRRPFAKVMYITLGDPRQGPLKLLANELDALEILADDVSSYRRLQPWQKSFALQRYKKFGYTYLAFNLKNPAVDTNIRRLFYNRLLCSSFLDIFLNGAGERVYSPFLYLSPEAGSKKQAVSPLDQRCRLRILVNSESTLRKQLALFLCEDMKRFNVELEPVFVEYQTFLRDLKRGNFDLAISAFLLDMDWNMKDVLSSSGYFNYAGSTDAHMDALLERGRREMDENKRRQIYVKAHQRWLETLPLLPLFNLDYHMGVSRTIRVPADRRRIVGSTGDFFYDFSGW
jgi:peptide/nickel transport system substrate-binding protein